MRDDFVAVVVCVCLLCETKKKIWTDSRCLTETKKKHTRKRRAKKKKFFIFFCENTQKEDG
jgi:hypothetical protein